MDGISASPRTTPNLASSLPALAHKVDDASQEFESVLLGQWLQQADASFGSVPGEEDESSDSSQMKNFAMQHLAQEITKSGGIGIAKIVQTALTKSAGISGAAGDDSGKLGKNINISQSIASELGPRSSSEDGNAK
ncbi:MAG TPA: hypothetical protein VGU25_00210 [Acidobacteriaceae bacterium]|nr:hypothetical protein [Acidobacteriaceae bacterium]